MAEQRLPIVDQDDGQWGVILNQFISKEHYDTGVNDPANGGHKNITIRPGTNTAGTAPLKFTSGPLLSSPEPGAVEFLNDKLYLTQTTNSTRKTIASYDDSSGATGDIYYRDSDANFTRLPLGSPGYVLTVDNGLPAWKSSTGSYLSKTGDTGTNLYTFNQPTLAGTNLTLTTGAGNTAQLTPLSIKSILNGTYYEPILETNNALRISSTVGGTTNQFRLLPSAGDVWFQNDNSAGSIYFSGLNGDPASLSEFRTNSTNFKTVNTNTDSNFGTGVGVKLYNTDTTVGNYTNIWHYNSVPRPTAGIAFKNVDQGYKGAMHFITRSSATDYGIRMYIDELGQFGLGAATVAGRNVNVYRSFGATSAVTGIFNRTDSTQTASSTNGIYSQVYDTPTGASSNITYGLASYVFSGSTYNHTGNKTACWFNVEHQGSGTMTNAYGIFGYNSISAGGTVTNSQGLVTRHYSFNGRIGTWYGVRIMTPTMGSAKTTSAYAVYIESQQASGSASKNISSITGGVSSLTVITSTAHYFQQNDTVVIAGTVNYNGTYTIGLIDSATQFTIYVSALGSTETVGTATVNSVITNNPYAIYQSGTSDFNYFGGNVSIGTSTSAYKSLYIARTITDGVNDYNANHTNITVNPAVDSDRAFRAGYFQVVGSGTKAMSSGFALRGIQGEAHYNGSANIGGIAALVAYRNHAATNGTITSSYGLYVFASGGASAVSASYGVYIAAQSGTGISNGYGVYQNSVNDRNYFAGNVGIGVSPSNTTQALNIYKTRQDAAVNAVNIEATPTTTTASSLRNSALDMSCSYSGANDLTANHVSSGYAWGGLMGFYGGTLHSGAGVVSTMIATSGQNLLRSGAVATNVFGLFSNPVYCDSGTATVTNAYGLYVKNPYNANATITNLWGIYLPDLDKATNSYAIVTNKGNIVFNEGGDANTDVRIEGDTDANLLFTDASADSVGIGTNAPTQKLDVSGSIRLKGNGIFLRLEDDTDNRYAEVGSADGRLILRSDPANTTATSYIAMEVDGTEQVRLNSLGYLGVGTNSPDERLQVVGSAMFGEDTTNYSKFEADGTLQFNGTATVFQDITASIAPDRVSGVSTAAKPNGFTGYRFNVNQWAEYPPQEVLHAYKEGSSIDFHVHWTTGVQDATDRAVKWQIEYSYITNGAVAAPFPVWTAATTISAETIIPANTPAGSEITTVVGSLLDANMKMGSRIEVRLTRITAAGTAPSSHPFVEQVGMHIEMDTVGSRAVSSK